MRLLPLLSCFVAGLGTLLAQGPAVVIHEVSAANSDRVLQFDPTGVPRLGCTPRWMDLNYSPTFWQSGSGPFGFGYTTQGTNLGGAMISKAVSVYLRKEFTPTASQLASGANLQLAIDFDDGFVAYLNGVEIARRNLGAAKAYAWHDQHTYNTHLAGTAETISLGAANSLLQSGTNLLAIQLHNNALAEGAADAPFTASGGGKLYCDAALTLAETTQVNLVSAADTWRYFVGVCEPSGGILDPTDLASLPNGPNWSQVDYVDTSWIVANGALGYDATLPPSTTSYVPQFGTGVNLSSMRNVSLAIFMRREFTLTQAELSSITGLSLTVDWDDGYALYLNGKELSRSNLSGTAGNLIAYNQTATDHGAAYDVSPAAPDRVVALPVPLSLLRAGKNVISGQAHNSSLGSSDLLLDVQFQAVRNGQPNLVLVARNMPWRYLIPTSEIGASVPAAPLVEPQFYDWIELKNTTGTDINLTGWKLSDAPDSPDKWTFPAGTSLPANGYMLVLCSGRDIFAPALGGYLHTNFSLSDSGEYVGLRDSTGALLSEVTGVPGQNFFHTWGIDPTSGSYRFLDQGTPGTANAGEAATDQVDGVDFDKETGFHDPGLTLSLSTNTPGAVIRYTLDGTEPTETNGSVYSGPFDPTVKPPTVGPGSGTILREVWKSPTNVYWLPSQIPVTTQPNSASLYLQAEGPVNADDWYGQRIRGYVHPLVTGTYTFYLASDDNGELWLSTNDNPANKSRIAYHNSWTNSREWTKFATQTSSPVTLTAGNRYYLEALSTEGGGGDHMAIGWSGPGFVSATVIDGRYLSPPEVLPSNLTPLPSYGVVRARAFAPGLLPSETKSRSYVTGADSRVRNFPALFLTGDPGRDFFLPNGIFSVSGGSWPAGDWIPGNTGLDYNFCLMHGRPFERPIGFEWVNPGNDVTVRTTVGLRFSGSVWSRTKYYNQGLEKGPWNSGWQNKPQMSLHFRGDLGISQLHQPGFLPASKLNDWETLKIRAGKNDAYNPFVVDEFIRRCFRDMGNPAPVGTFMCGFINGDLKGYFNLCERPMEEFWQEYFDSANAWDVTPNDWAANLNYDWDWQSGDSLAWKQMMTYFQQNDFSNTAAYETGKSYWDLNNVIDYYITNCWTGMQDWPGNNFYFAHERIAGGKWYFSMWDAEGGFGSFGQANTINEFDANLLVPENGSRSPTITTDGLTTRLVLRRFYQNLEFRLAFADRLQKHFFNGGVLSSARITTLHDSLKNTMAPVIKAVNGADFWDGWWTDWVVASNRTNTFLMQCRSLGMWPTTTAPSMTPLSGTISPTQRVTLGYTTSGSGYTIYYTTDGSDPRAGGGAIQGQAYALPIQVLAPTTIKARTRSTSGEWSPLMEGSFAPPPPTVVFTEIHYNPPGSGDLTEFLELTNIGGGSANLNGAHFTSGIEYTFGNVSIPAGQSIVLVRDSAGFAASYPGVAATGVYSGALDNSGDTLTLVDIAGQVIASTTYGDSNTPGWPEDADGEGYSLVLMRPWTIPNSNLPENWRLSALTGGQPGTQDSTPLAAVAPLSDEDSDGYSALLEYALGTGANSSASRPALTSDLDAGGALLISVIHPLDRDEANLQALESSDFATWQAAEFVSDINNGDGTATLTWRLSSVTAAGGRGYLKLVATQIH